MSQPPTAFDFHARARHEMIRQGFQPDFPPAVMAEANAARPADLQHECRDLRDLLWSSIDNPDSRDLDQIEWAEKLPDGRIRVLVAIADVDATVKQNSATDLHAGLNATSVYTGGPVFSMLPERLSTGLTSLCVDEDRPAVIMEFVAGDDGQVVCSEACTARVRNRAKLNYDQVGNWLQTGSATPCDGPVPPGLPEQLRLQHEVALRLRNFRKEHGALAFGGIESVPIVVNNEVSGFAIIKDNPARNIIESFMVAANVAMARFLRARRIPAVRRIVRTPKRWDRIREIAAGFGTTLPVEPQPLPLSEFMAAQKEADPDHFPELSLSILKSMGPGEYIVEQPGREREGHFGLAVDDYTHSTAPNRRYADLLMQRLIKAALAETAAPYTVEELTALAKHCTERESAAKHAERFMKKVAAALLLKPQVGKAFEGIVTGVTEDGTYVRLLTVPAEGRIIRAEKGLDVGYKVRVRLVNVDPNRGFIDFEALR